MPRVTIVTPTKNRLTFLRETIDSVQAQHFKEWEHVVIDDGSDDGTTDELRRLSGQDPRIRYIRRSGEMGGANVCRNIGVRESRGEYILFLDSDDLLQPDCLARRVPLLDRNADVDFITFRTSFFVDKLGDQHLSDPDLLGDDLIRFLFFETPWIITGPLWRKSSLVHIGLLDEALPSWQDIELHVRALTAGLRYLRFSDVDHHVRWQNKVSRISKEQRKSPKHLYAAISILEKLELLIREGPGINWIRQRGLCSLYFFVAECWVESGNLSTALNTWTGIRKHSLGTRLLHASGSILLVLKATHVPCKRLIGKWKGWVRFRTNAELVSPRTNDYPDVAQCTATNCMGHNRPSAQREQGIQSLKHDPQ
jgi:glycosyltransferase involved in cell wall biosynthesis